MRYLWPVLGCVWVVAVILYAIFRGPSQDTVRVDKSLENKRRELEYRMHKARKQKP